ncbi:site-specific integrase [Colwellia piezophila]|uniref:site-specific integrase n=1 Tax=Colwellia piezophila TaxID=211668 RepID=UPI0003624E7E|nr:site-specific integrase [Colwellia piezophila]
MASYKITPKAQKKKGSGFVVRVRCKSKPFSRSEPYDKSSFFTCKEIAKTFGENEKHRLEQLNQINNTPEYDKKLVLFSNFKASDEIELSNSSSLGDFIKSFLKYNETIPKPFCNTAKGALNKVLQHTLSGIPYNQVTYNDLAIYCEERLETCSASTVRIDISSLKRAINDMADIRKIELSTNPITTHYSQLKKAGYIANSGTRVRRLKKGELRRIIREFRKYQKSNKVTIIYSALVCLYISTCLRRSELVALTWGDIDFENGEITISTGKNTKPGTNSADVEPRDVPMLDITESILSKIKPDNASDDMLIFDIKAESLSSIFPRIMAKIGIEDLRLHDLRRESISQFLEAGFSENHISLFTGHRDIKMIREVYNAMKVKNIVNNKNQRSKCHNIIVKKAA